MKTNSGFDFLAPVYDQLARFIFGKSIIDSQTWFLNKIKPGSRILILGGGTGWLLEKLDRCVSSYMVLYVDISSRMIEKARHRMLQNEVHFIQGTEEDIPTHLKFDVIITNFYLDLFSDKTLTQVIQRVNFHATPSSIWIVTDFTDGGKWWHKGVLKIMYLFFRMVCGIEANHLPALQNHLNDTGWKKFHTKNWCGEFIESMMWWQPKVNSKE